MGRSVCPGHVQLDGPFPHFSRLWFHPQPHTWMSPPWTETSGGKNFSGSGMWIFRIFLNLEERQWEGQMKQGLILITVTVVGVKECPAIHRYCPGMGEEVKQGRAWGLTFLLSGLRGTSWAMRCIEMRQINLALENATGKLPQPFPRGRTTRGFIGFFPALPGHLNLSTCPLQPLSWWQAEQASLVSKFPLLWAAPSLFCYHHNDSGPCGLSRAITGKALPQLSAFLAGCSMV